MYRIKVNLFLLLQILSSFATLLRKQDASVWTYPTTLQAYHGLLSFAVHSKPKVCLLRTPLNARSNYQLSSPLNKNKYLNFHVFQVRKAAQQGVCAILKGSDFLFTDDAPAHHPAAVSTAKFCIKEMERAGGARPACACLHIPLFGCTRNLKLFLTASLRQQRGHYHTSCAGPPEGADGDISSGSCQIMLRDSAASDDTQPRGENINIHKCSQVLPSLFSNPAALLVLRSWWQPAPCRPFIGCSVRSRAHWPSRPNSTRRSSR